MDVCLDLPISISTSNEILPVSVSATEQIDLEFDSVGFPIFPDVYNGSYHIVPSSRKQVIEIKGLMAANDITIEKIPERETGKVPDNYGLITWNGSFLRVS